MLKQKLSPTPPRGKIMPAPADTGTVSCDECASEVPAEKAIKSEAQDYVRHFCGLECYGRWQKRQMRS
jgi:hypothetical protein